jgi:hypothetical protein
MFRVLWIRPALDELAALWAAGDSNLRRNITASSNLIDRELQVDPYRSSESRYDESRVLFVYPLGVQIEIELEQRIVWVLHVWRFRRRGE